MPKRPKRTCHFPTINFWGRTVSFREGNTTFQVNTNCYRGSLDTKIAGQMEQVDSTKSQYVVQYMAIVPNICFEMMNSFQLIFNHHLFQKNTWHLPPVKITKLGDWYLMILQSGHILSGSSWNQIHMQPQDFWFM